MLGPVWKQVLVQGSASCFHLLNVRGSQSVTQGRCEALGSNLASIHSAEEHQYVVGKVSLERYTDAWIGLKAKYEWLDGTTFDYNG